MKDSSRTKAIQKPKFGDHGCNQPQNIVFDFFYGMYILSSCTKFDIHEKNPTILIFSSYVYQKSLNEINKGKTLSVWLFQT